MNKYKIKISMQTGKIILNLISKNISYQLVKREKINSSQLFDLLQTQMEYESLIELQKKFVKILMDYNILKSYKNITVTAHQAHLIFMCINPVPIHELSIELKMIEDSIIKQIKNNIILSYNNA